jgi:hypothetical protein
MDGIEAHINFDAPAVLRKWPDLRSAASQISTGLSR